MIDRKLIFRLIAFLQVIILFSCKKDPVKQEIPPFETTAVQFPIVPGKIDEASGITPSNTNPGYLWVQQDSGNPTDITLLSYGGEVLKKVYLKGFQNRDWEDIAAGNGPEAGKKYIYIADIGDNSLVHDKYFIYRFEERSRTIDTITQFEKITFTYPDGQHDAEAILLDDDTKNIYIITKKDTNSIVYKLAYPQNTSGDNVVTKVASLNYSLVTAASFSPDLKSMLVRTYSDVFYYERKQGESLEKMFTGNYVSLTHLAETQGESICFKKDNSGYFTLSEKGTNAVSLNYYKRN